MSRKGNRYDNAVVESFFGTLKQECIHRSSFATRDGARQRVFAYIEVWYNRKRGYLFTGDSSLGYVNPVEFEEKARQGAKPA